MKESANFSTPSRSSVGDDVVVVDPGLGDPLEDPLRLVEVPLERGRDLAVVLERLDRLLGHRVHGLGADQLLDVHHVAVLRVLRRGRGPEAALRACAPFACQRLPALAREELLVALVGELRVRDRELALQLGGRTDLVEPPVGLGVDARDEEAGDRRDRAGVAAALDEPLEPAQVGLDDLGVALEREDQRDVDRCGRAAIISSIAGRPGSVAGILT